MLSGGDLRHTGVLMLRRALRALLIVLVVVAGAVGVGMIVADIWTPTRGVGAALFVAAFATWLLLLPQGGQ